MSALKRVKVWLDPKLDWPDEHEVWIGGMMPCRLGDLREVVARVEDAERRAKLATRYLKTIHSGQFVTASLVVAAIRTLDPREPLPLAALAPKRAKGRVRR